MDRDTSRSAAASDLTFADIVRKTLRPRIATEQKKTHTSKCIMQTKNAPTALASNLCYP